MIKLKPPEMTMLGESVSNLKKATISKRRARSIAGARRCCTNSDCHDMRQRISGPEAPTHGCSSHPVKQSKFQRFTGSGCTLVYTWSLRTLVGSAARTTVQRSWFQ